MDDTPRQRIGLYGKPWEYGGFTLTNGNYCDLMTEIEASHATYNF
jgi:hypothetical protein